MTTVMMRCAAVGLALVAASPAAARNWYALSISDKRDSAVFLDRDSIAEAAGSMMRSNTFTYFIDGKPGGATAYQTTLEFDCKESRYRILTLTVFDVAMRVTSDGPASGQWRDVPDESQVATLRRYTCSRGTDPGNVESVGAELPYAAAKALLRGEKPEAPSPI